ncbi:probable E3 ubiquitin-protein ligase makorin-1 [Physella acuta]|uniref:probable E3 ubiquitin-protein ligase makorin-1 n=1 Tax=Physella acuta TaxID=109671 RepID=UPI0027DE781A|nr:probable E3 ubiquitin-protein ligase makorin-1 [Physella acuta]
MAEGGYDPKCRSISKNQPKFHQVCRYFLHGACNKGEQCSYVHDRSGAVPVENVCRYYQFGRCSYGNNCRYDHVKVNKHNTNSSASQHQAVANGTTSKGIESGNRVSNMVTLKKGGYKNSAQSTSKSKVDQSQWVKARDFVPGQKYHGAVSYSDAVHPLTYSSDIPSESTTVAREEALICPYYAQGACHFEEKCAYIHGDLCDMCGMPRLHPYDALQREAHQRECIADHEKDMELSFAIQASQDKECGICLEIVIDKDINCSSSDKRFGILENCNHCFCLSCIRQWRNSKSMTIQTHRACPTCRTHSDFVTPSKYWVECPEKKQQLINEYKEALSAKPCSYFKQGRGECPFNSKCFYRHALPDGTRVESNVVQRRRRTNADGQSAAEDEFSLWDFISRREEDTLMSLEDELSLVLLGLYQDSDDDDNNNSLFRYRYNFDLSDFDDSSSDSDFY